MTETVKAPAGITTVTARAGAGRAGAGGHQGVGGFHHGRGQPPGRGQRGAPYKHYPDRVRCCAPWWCAPTRTREQYRAAMAHATDPAEQLAAFAAAYVQSPRQPATVRTDLRRRPGQDTLPALAEAGQALFTDCPHRPGSVWRDIRRAGLCWRSRPAPTACGVPYGASCRTGGSAAEAQTGGCCSSVRADHDVWPTSWRREWKIPGRGGSRTRLSSAVLSGPAVSRGTSWKNRPLDHSTCRERPVRGRRGLRGQADLGGSPVAPAVTSLTSPRAAIASHGGTAGFVPNRSGRRGCVVRLWRFSLGAESGKHVPVTPKTGPRRTAVAVHLIDTAAGLM